MSNHNLINLGSQVLKTYELCPDDLRPIQSGEIRTIWKFKSGEKLYCLKRLKRTPGKAAFTVEAQNYIARRKGLVAPIVANIKGQSITEFNGELFVVYEWIEGRDLNFSQLADLKRAVQGLADFHLASEGYKPPAGCEISSKLGRWPYHYRDMITRLETWRKANNNSTQAKINRVFNENADEMIRLGQKCITLLEQSAYSKWVKQLEDKPILCHQDFGAGNCLWTKKGLYVLDLDGVTFDLPVRDLRKIILKRMSVLSKWDGTLMTQIVNWYCEKNPLTSEQLKVLYIDLLFPHEFHDTAKNPFLKGKSIDSAQIIKAARLARSKNNQIKAQI
ncbi:MAG: CotS family spore coat protein [Chitinophagales bacterium]